MRIAIVDDSPTDLEITRISVNSAFPQVGLHIDMISCYDNGVKLLDEFKENTYDIIFMDIIMDQLDGISTAEKIREKDEYVKIVFTSTSNEYAAESYRVKADYYLIKPMNLHYDGLIAMLRSLDLTEQENKRYITLPGGTDVILRNIVFTEYYNHIIEIHMKDGSVVKTRMRQLDLETMLLAYPFFVTCSKGTVVNLYEAAEISKDVLSMSDGTDIPISRRRQKDVEASYSKVAFDKMRKEMYV